MDDTVADMYWMVKGLLCRMGRKAKEEFQDDDGPYNLIPDCEKCNERKERGRDLILNPLILQTPPFTLSKFTLVSQL